MTGGSELTCIVCPLGCRICVTAGDDGSIKEITGNGCKRGAAYAEAEFVNPLRIVTSTVRVNNGSMPLVPVKTDRPVPKSSVMDCMKEINRTIATGPVKTGDVLIKNILNTGADVVATGNV